MLPVGDAGQDVALEVGHDAGHGLGRLGRRGGQPRGDLAGDDLRPHGVALDRPQIVGHPIDHGVGMFAEFLVGHGTGPPDGPDRGSEDVDSAGA